MSNDTPRFEARNAGVVRLEGRKSMEYPVHIVFVDKDSKERKRIRFVADFNHDLPGTFQLAEMIVQELNAKGFILP